MYGFNYSEQLCMNLHCIMCNKTIALYKNVIFCGVHKKKHDASNQTELDSVITVIVITMRKTIFPFRKFQRHARRIRIDKSIVENFTRNVNLFPVTVKMYTDNVQRRWLRCARALKINALYYDRVDTGGTAFLTGNSLIPATLNYNACGVGTLRMIKNNNKYSTDAD